jgi:signal transduction histidine kinase
VAQIERQRTLLQRVVEAVRSRLESAPQIAAKQHIESLAQFAAGAGHELNNPLAVIMGRAQLLLQRTQEPEAQRSLRVIIGQCQRAHRMLRDLMYIARPVEPRSRPCQAGDIVRRCLDDLRDDADSRGVSIRLESDTESLMVHTDPEQLRHVVEVLVRNALEACSSGEQVVVRLAYRGESIVIEVWDQGRGIPPELGRHLFVPFFCGRHAGRGLGLGLPRVAHYVSSVGGTLKWSSKPGVGTVFRVTLPAPVETRISAA